MKIDGKQPISRLAAELPGAIPVFESFGIEYSCAGERSLEDAAYEEGIDPETVLAVLRRLRTNGRGETWADRPLLELVRYLVDQHHRFIREELASIALRLADLCAAPSPLPPQFHSLREEFSAFSELVVPHMHREEKEVFRAVESLENAWSANEPLEVTGLAEHIRQLTLEHAGISSRLRAMRELRAQLRVSNDLSPRCLSVLDRLETLEAHLHEYMFLENCILFPRALAIEGRQWAVGSRQ